MSARRRPPSLSLSPAPGQLPLPLVSPGPSSAIIKFTKRDRERRRTFLLASCSFVTLVLLGLGLRTLGEGLSSSRHAVSVEPPRLDDLRIFLYDMPNYVDRDVRLRPYTEEWLMGSREYDSDIWTYDLLSLSRYRTFDASEATLFMIPVFPTRYLHHNLYNLGWTDAINQSSQHLADALDHVKALPYFARRNGADHFVVMPIDAGRCVHLLHLPRQAYGDLFTIQHHGALDTNTLRHDLKVEGIPVEPCYRPDHDILLPALVPHEEAPLAPIHIKPPRNITALFAFDHEAATSNEPYHGIHVRKELRELWTSAPPLEGAVWSVTDLLQTTSDMANALTCVTPPGIVAHTSRFWRALRRGCIPVTHFRANRLAFDTIFDYDAFTLNLEPSDVYKTLDAINDLVRDRDRLSDRQSALAEAQRWLDWEAGENEPGIAMLLLHELEQRAIAASRIRPRD